jgi:hypothetical protein
MERKNMIKILKHRDVTKMPIRPILRESGKDWVIKTSRYSLLISKTTGCAEQFHDRRDPKDISVINPAHLFPSLAYTLQEDDITHRKKAAFTPYLDREADFPDGIRPLKTGLQCWNKKLDTFLQYGFQDDCIRLEIFSSNPQFSEFGLNLPFQFLGEKGTSYLHQFLPSTPYVSSGGQYRYWFLSKPNGHPLLVTYLTEADGWKLDYSPYAWGHFIENLKVLDSFDRAFGKQTKKRHRISVTIRFPDSFADALEQAAGEYGCPAAYPAMFGGKTGTKLAVRIIGSCDSICIKKPNRKKSDFYKLDRMVQSQTWIQIPLNGYGIQTVTPCFQGKEGLDCRVFVYDDIMKMFRRNCLSIRRPYHTDNNLCEGGVWAEALCRNMRLMGKSEFMNRQVQEQLNRVLPEPGGQKIVRCSILPNPAEGYPAYHIYRSMRVQEQFFGISFLIQAYRLYGTKHYLDYAISSMMSLLRYHIKENGEIIRQKHFYEKDGKDYTTVTAPVIAIVDLARILKAEGDSRFRIFENAAVQTADYLVKRGIHFPTEGMQNSKTEDEMEDGSISCTALSILYVCYYISRKKGYLEFAEKILNLHDAWTIHTPDARLNRSTLRWWETIWEGDANGPAICGGHAWTLWRAEADYYYALLTCDTGRLMDSYNAFLTNLSKIKRNGESYACYQPDEIPGGGEASGSAEITFRPTGGFPKTTDQSLSKYLWLRMEDTWMKTAAILHREKNEFPVNGNLTLDVGGIRQFKPDLKMVSRLFLDAAPGSLLINSETNIQIITKQTLQISALYNPVRDGYNWYVTPQENHILVKIR